MEINGTVNVKSTITGELNVSRTEYVLPSIKALTAEANGVYLVPEGYDGFNPVLVDVPEKQEQKKTVNITENGSTSVVPDSGKVLSGVEINVDVEGGNQMEDTTYKGCYYRLAGDEKEWINPPMVVGTEYRTAERYEGKPVYTKLVDFGNLPNSARKSVSTGIAGQYAIDMQFNIHMQGNQLTHFPYVSSGYEAVTRSFLNTVGELVMDTKTDLSAYTAKVAIKYTKS